MTARRPRVVFWDNLPAPYAIERYNLLADRGTCDFVAWFSRRTDPDRMWEVDESRWRFAAAYVEDPGESLTAMHQFIRRCDRLRPDLVVSLYGERPFVVGFLILKAMGVRTALVVEHTFDAWIRRTWWKEAAKALLFRAADAAQVHSPPTGKRDDAQATAYARRYGVPDSRIFPVTCSIDVRGYAADAEREQRKEIRERLGVDGCLFLYVGRFWRGKGVRFLLDAFAGVRSADSRTSLLLIGNGPDEAEVRSRAAQSPGVSVWSFVPLTQLRGAYAAADVFVFPTLGDPVGLVVEEAHAAGLPVIATTSAGDIRSRVTDGETGFVVPPADPAVLAERMLRLAANPALREEMGARGAKRVRAWDHAAWREDFDMFVRGLLASPPRRTASARLTAAAGGVLIAAADVAARARTWLGNAVTRGAGSTLRATILARLNRLGMWVMTLPWRLRAPRETLRKFGTAHGGWTLPVNRLVDQGVCYCVGLGEDSSLEDDLLRHTGCVVWSFDPTPRAIAHAESQRFDPERFQFVPVGIWDRTETVRFFQHINPEYDTHSPVNLWETDAYLDAPCTTVAALMRQFHHTALTLLKVDVEGGEWRVLENILEDGPDVSVLCVIFCQPAAFWRVSGMMARLRRAGYAYLRHEQWKFTFVRIAGVLPAADGD